MALLWCVVIGLELFFLLNDITLFKGTQSEHRETIGKQIAELQFSSSGVRWQNPRDVVWNESVPGQAMYEGQSVMTLSGAQARLVFDAQGKSDANSPAEVIEIGERSLIELRAPETGVGADAPLLLSLLRGNVKSKIGRKVLLTAGEFQIQLEPGAKFEAVQTGDLLRLGLESGAASAVSIRGPDGATPSPISITPGQAIEISTRPSTGTEPRVTPVVRPITAATSSAPSALPSAIPSSLPSPVPSAVPSSVPSSVPTAAPAASPARLPPPKMRAPILRPRNVPAKPEGALRRFWDRLFPNAHAESPASAAPEWEIELQWDAVPDAKAYRVEISRTRSFKTRVTDATVTAPSWIWLYRRGMENSKGRVFYRVASIAADGTAGAFSEPRTLTIPTEILTGPKPPSPKPAAIAKTTAPAKPPTSPQTIVSTVPPRANANSLATANPARSAPPLPTRWSLRPSVEYRSQTQTSDYPLLRKAEPSGGFLHEGLRVERESERFLFSLGIRGSHYEKTDPAPGESAAPLTKTRSFEGRVSLYAPYSRRAAGWRRSFFYGATGFLEDRFTKAGANRLSLRRGFSLGPAAGLRSESAWAAISLPLTGLLGSGDGALAGPYGVTVEAQKNWPLGRLAPRTSIFLSVGAEGSWHYWKAPSDSRVVEWALGIGPKVVFE